MAQATIGVIGGSGVYSMDALEGIEEVRLSTPFGEPSDAYIIGTLHGQRVAFLPRHGVGHRYTPSEVPSRANIYGFKQLGVKTLISISAVGSLREDYAPGHVVIPDQLIDKTKGIRPFTFFNEGVVAHIAFDYPFDPTLQDILYRAAEQAGATVHRGGTLVVMEGPQFSTLAESEDHRRQGFALIGMTALPEAKLAREAEMAYATLALVTDYDCWHPDHSSVTVEMVVKILHHNAELARSTVRHAVASIGDGFESPAHHALATAIMTDPARIPEQKRQQLALLAGHYLNRKA